MVRIRVFSGIISNCKNTSFLLLHLLLRHKKSSREYPSCSERLTIQRKYFSQWLQKPLYITFVVLLALACPWSFLRDSASSFHWLSSSIFSCCCSSSSRIGNISSHIHYMMFPSIQTIYFLEDMILVKCQYQHIFCC